MLCIISKRSKAHCSLASCCARKSIGMNRKEACVYIVDPTKTLQIAPKKAEELTRQTVKWIDSTLGCLLEQSSKRDGRIVQL